MWLYNHMIALGEEYTKRYGKEHLTITKCKTPLVFLPPLIPCNQDFKNHHSVCQINTKFQVVVLQLIGITMNKKSIQ